MGIASAEFHCWQRADEVAARKKGRFVLDKFGFYLNDPIVDLGCGEGALLLALKESGKTDFLGVESNDELAALANSFGVPVRKMDILQFMREEEPRVATYLYIDVLEHVPFEANLELIQRIPWGSRLIIQTPHTETLRGHIYYFNVPSHLAAYSPHVIRKMLERHGYAVISEGSVDDRHPDNWQRKLRALLVRKLLALPDEMVLGGGNYFVVADRVQGEHAKPSA